MELVPQCPRRHDRRRASDGAHRFIRASRRDRRRQAMGASFDRRHGHGMDEPTRARIFEPFFSTKERGTGLRPGGGDDSKYVTEFGGHIDVWSQPEEGTRFDIWLPRG